MWGIELKEEKEKMPMPNGWTRARVWKIGNLFGGNVFEFIIVPAIGERTIGKGILAICCKVTGITYSINKLNSIKLIAENTLYSGHKFNNIVVKRCIYLLQTKTKLPFGNSFWKHSIPTQNAKQVK